LRLQVVGCRLGLLPVAGALRWGWLQGIAVHHGGQIYRPFAVDALARVVRQHVVVARGHELGVHVPAIAWLDILGNDVLEGQLFFGVQGEEAQHLGGQALGVGAVGH